MTFVGQHKSNNPAGAIHAMGIVCMAAACIITATPAFAQDASGMAQNGVQTASTAQQERTGISNPDPVVITETPYNDNTDSIDSLPPAKPSAATPKPAPAATPTPKPAPAFAPMAATATHPNAAVKSTDVSAFDPDANIVTEETAGRADRLLVSGTQTEVKHYQDESIVTRVPSRPGEVPDGTLIKVKLMEELSTLTAVPGSNFSAELTEPVMRDGQVVVPAGALLEGHITLVRQGMRIGPSAALHLVAETVTLPDGSQYALDARVIDTDSWNDTKVDHEGTILRKDHGKATAATVSLSAGGGMAAGAIVGGLPGALIGAGVGVGVSTVVWMRQDRQADLPQGLGVVFCLTEPMRTTPMSPYMTGAGGAGAE
jgi:cytochrome b